MIMAVRLTISEISGIKGQRGQVTME